MTASTIKELPDKVMASKSDWGVATDHLGFTPKDDSLAAKSRCERNIYHQFNHGYVLEYITESMPNPHPGYETREQRQERKAEHKRHAGGLVAVHRLRHTSRPRVEFIGEEAYKRSQDMWAQEGRRWRWAVAFPIIESHKIIGEPKARDVFGEDLCRRLLWYQARELKPLTDDARALIADLKIQKIEVSNDNVHISEDTRIKRDVEEDFGSLEGVTEQRKIKWLSREPRLRMAFLDSRATTMHCDCCGWNPTKKAELCGLPARSLFDVHHKRALADGVRTTMLEDLSLLCPRCHRIEHVKLNAGRRR